MNTVYRMRVRLVDAAQTAISLFGCSSRTAEYKFVFGHLPETGSAILDVGCCGSLLPLKLAHRGYKVHAVDTRCYPERHPNLEFVQCDILGTPFPGEFFDCVIAVSTIEHIGLGLYGDPIHDEEADVVAMEEIRRITKTGRQSLANNTVRRKIQTGSLCGGSRKILRQV